MIKKTFPILLAITILVAACSFTMQTGGPEWWLSGCDGFPPLEEVSQVLKEQEKLIERLQEEGLIHSAGAATCGVTPEMADTMLAQGIPPKGFIILYRLESQTKVLAALDEVGARSEGTTTFFGAPLRFIKAPSSLPPSN